MNRCHMIPAVPFAITTFLACLAVLTGASRTPDDPEFTDILVSEHADMWWARAPVDLDGNGFVDLALQDNNAHGGWLGTIHAFDRHNWEVRTIADAAPGGGTFASGDLDAGDIDLDGDPDILGFEHTGEWDSAGAPTTIYWYANPGWEPSVIGTAPDFVKDVNLADLNGDGKPDLATITYQEHNLKVIRQDDPHTWVTVLDTALYNLHEGMDVGDIDGDGDADIAVNGYWAENPGGDMTGGWPIRSIDSIWHNQEGDWSANATKVCCRDIDGDGRSEVFISHSERSGYPVACYRPVDPSTDQWTKEIITGDFPAAHTLQAFDFDLDGDIDLLTGTNAGRARALGINDGFPVVIFFNEGGGNWTEFPLTNEGIYNGQCADIEGDGDVDIFWLSSHDAGTLKILANLIR